MYNSLCISLSSWCIWKRWLGELPKMNLWPVVLYQNIYCDLHVWAGGPREVCWDFCFDPKQNDWSITVKAEWRGGGANSAVTWVFEHNAAKVHSSLWNTVILQKPLNLLFTSQILSALCSRCLSLRRGGSSKGLQAGDCEREWRKTGRRDSGGQGR